MAHIAKAHWDISLSAYIGDYIVYNKSCISQEQITLIRSLLLGSEYGDLLSKIITICINVPLLAAHIPIDFVLILKAATFTAYLLNGSSKDPASTHTNSITN